MSDILLIWQYRFFLWSSESIASRVQILQDQNILMKSRDTCFLNLMHSFSFVKSFSLSFGCACLVCSSHIIKNIWDVLVIYSQDTQCRYVWNADMSESLWILFWTWKFWSNITLYHYTRIKLNRLLKPSTKRKYVRRLMAMLKMRGKMIWLFMLSWADH